MLEKIYNKKYITLLVALFITLTHTVSAQLTIAPGSTAALLSNKLAGPGITIISDTLVCNNAANGIFRSVIAAGNPISIDSGIILCTGSASAASGSEPSVTSTSFSSAGDADVTTLMGGGVSRDACALIITFVPKGDTVSFDYQFGSEEYRSATCGPYNDAFGFFIAGPGISATYPGVNMALVPGTNIPVAVNSINSGTAGTCSGCAYSNCTSMGSGSPFTAYFVANSGGTIASYRGYTTKLTAKHWVVPCDTYRIKLVIADGGTTASPNYIYDSGVFIAAGSLKTNSYHFDHANLGHMILGYTNAVVKGCGTDSVKIKSTRPAAVPTKLYITYAGTGVAGVDYTALPDSVTLATGDTSFAFPVLGLTTAASGVKTIVAYLSSSALCGIIDTVTINLIDHPTVSILTSDTTVCNGTPVHIQATTSTGLTYGWSPGTYLDNPSFLNPIATPTAVGVMIYTITATLPGSLCPAITKTITITTVEPTVTVLTADTTVCQGASFTLRVDGPDSLIYSWSPVTNLNSAGVKQPVFNPQATTTFTLTASILGTTCKTQKQLKVTVIPTDFVITTFDTFFCTGATLYLNGVVNPPASTYTYLWTGPGGYSSPLLNPVITTVTAGNEGTYTLTVTNSGLCSGTAMEKIIIYPTPEATVLAPPIELCQYSPALALEVPGYDNLMWYSSSTDPKPTVFAPLPSTDSVGVFKYYASQISFKNNCLSERVAIDVTVKSCCTGNVFVPSAFTPNEDGKNDVLRVVRTSDYALNDFTIYNRWGMVVFQSSGEKQAWDGTFNGQPADMGTYYYVAIITCKNSDKKNITLKGDVTLIR